MRKNIQMSGFQQKMFDDEIEQLLTKAEEIIPNDILPDLPYMELSPGVHEWYAFEHKLWALGEEIRQLFLKSNKKLDEKHMERIINICLDKRAKRGRQSFIMLLGKKHYPAFSEKIVSLLDDDEVHGHIIHTIYKMQAGQYVELINPFLNHKQAWIRNEAKRYVQKYG